MFEKLRKQDPSEVQAWQQYRNGARGSLDVVFASQYDRGTVAVQTKVKKGIAGQEDKQRKKQKTSGPPLSMKNKSN